MLITKRTRHRNICWERSCPGLRCFISEKRYLRAQISPNKIVDLAVLKPHQFVPRQQQQLLDVGKVAEVVLGDQFVSLDHKLYVLVENRGGRLSDLPGVPLDPLEAVLQLALLVLYCLIQGLLEGEVYYVLVVKG